MLWKKKEKKTKIEERGRKKLVQLWWVSVSAFGHSHPWPRRNCRERGKERGCCSVPSASAFVSPAGSGRTAMSAGRERREEGEERRLLKVGGKFGSAAKLTQLSSPLLKRNFGSPTPACLPALALHPLLPFPPRLPFSFSFRLALRTVLAILPIPSVLRE